MEKKQKYKFSVIVPCYNSEAYIKRNLNSLAGLKLDGNKLEVIVIDDGSSNDITKKICEEYIDKKLLNIIYIKKVNGNWGSVINYVRNNSLATGDIVSVLDSDDFYAEDVVKIVAKRIGTCDAVIGNFRNFNGKKNGLKIYTHISLISHAINNQTHKTTPFCLPLPYFFKKEIFYGISDLQEKMFYQDGDFTTQILKLSKDVMYVNETFGYYFHNRDGNSMSEQWNDARTNSLICVCNKCILNDAQEQVVYKLFANGKLLKNLKSGIYKDTHFIVKRKFKFSWFPFYVRWIFLAIFKLRYERFFVYSY